MAAAIVTVPDTTVSSVLLANTTMIPHFSFNMQEKFSFLLVSLCSGFLLGWPVKAAGQSFYTSKLVK